MIQKVSDFIIQITNKQFLVLSIVLSLLLYGNTLTHKYCLDDAIVITKNEFTKQGFNGIKDILSHDSFTGFFGKEKKLVDGGRYRPLSLISFAIEYQFLGEKPFFSHLINIVLYALVVFLCYIMSLKLFSLFFDLKQRKFLSFVFSIIFLIHPIHTEVVANIKGRDEILSLLFSLLSFIAVLNYHQSKKLYLLTLAAVLFFLGLLSKENTIAFLAIIPLGIIIFKKVKLNRIILSSVALLTATIAFLIIRNNVLGGFHSNTANELMNNPFLEASAAQKYGTILYTWLIYLKLLVFPHPLTFDYYPYHIPLVKFWSILPLITVIIILALIITVVKQYKNHPIFAFALFGFAASFSMVSNLLFPVGTFMNERFMFMPSLFASLAFAYSGLLLLSSTSKIKKATIIILSTYLVLLFPAKTMARNQVWENDFTLFTNDVKISDNSAKSNCSAGGKLWEEAKITANSSLKNKYYKLSEQYLKKAIKIHPNYTDAWLLLGNVLFDAKKDVKNATIAYIEVLKRQPQNENAWQNIDIVLQNTDDRKLQMEYYTMLNKIDNNRYLINYRLGVIYGRYYNKMQQALVFLNKAYTINPNKVDAIKDLGTAYGILGDSEQAYAFCKKALEIDPNDPQIHINLGISLSNLGKATQAKQHFEIAEKLKAQK